jgi:hypothetical protein
MMYSMNVVAELMMKKLRQRHVPDDSKAQPSSTPVFFEVVDQ